MFDYIKAEVYRTRKTSNNWIMWVLGILAIGLTVISMKSFDDVPYRDNFYFGIAQMLSQMAVFISILIMGASFKKDFEEKNYVQKGYNRSNIIWGDLAVATLSRIVKAVGLTILVYLSSLLFKADPVNPHMDLNDMLLAVFCITLAVFAMNCGTYMIYNVSGKSGVASMLSFLLYLLIPQIMSAFMEYDTFLGKLCKHVYNLTPMNNFFNLSRYFENDGFEMNWKYFIAMLVINFIVFNAISLISKKRKRY
ncbi:hypothetical protein [Ezakiella peruensis]|uniref:hypothetical protein n=1 Tax=Ezakiella peruensis TaxID=1464038 RepID=UPI000C1B24BD|nr:hypothetical protein [Ezakiella peruensis]